MLIFLPKDQDQQPDRQSVGEKLKPQIVVYALADACAALAAAAARDIAITLVSPAGAAAFAGPGWFREVVAQAAAAVPDAAFDHVLDCADDAGHAMAAIRDGATAIRFEGPAAARRKIKDIAAQSGCALADIDYDRALDLDNCDDAARACGDWLALKSAGDDT